VEGNKTYDTGNKDTGMTIQELTADLDIQDVRGNIEGEVSSIAVHSHNAGPDSLFVAIAGSKADGHDFLDTVYRAGSRAFVTERPFHKTGTVNIIVPDSRRALACLAATFYGHPSRHMTLIGITGTNGKTTTAFLIESMLREAGHEAGLLSTIEYRFGTRRCSAHQTTPDSLALQRTLSDMAAEGVSSVVMEVSSHGLDQRRVESCHFDVGIFTNLSPEHLDYHKTMDDYFSSKQRFFTEVLPGSAKNGVAAVINADDPMGRNLLEQTPCTAVGYGVENGAVRAHNISLSLEGISADISTPGGRFSITSRLVGTFNLYNILAAVAAAWHLGLSRTAIMSGIEKTAGVPGRMEPVDNRKKIRAFVDFAHTGDALENVLNVLSRGGAQRIITVFGCGGDRDREKRPVMGKIAAAASSIVIITSDNPRSEHPEDIIRQIERGVREKSFVRAHDDTADCPRRGVYFIIPDRRDAIRLAVFLAGPGDVVLVAGKGHETTQQIGNDLRHFDDREEIRRACAQEETYRPPCPGD